MLNAVLYFERKTVDSNEFQLFRVDRVSVAIGMPMRGALENPHRHAAEPSSSIRLPRLTGRISLQFYP